MFKTEYQNVELCTFTIAAAWGKTETRSTPATGGQIGIWLTTKQLVPRLKAREALEAMGNEASCLLADLLDADIREWRLRKRWVYIATLTSLALSLAVMAHFGLLFLLLTTSAVCAVRNVVRLAALRARMRNVMDLLAPEARPAQICVGPLLDIYLYTDTVTSLMAANKLVALLPRMGAGHSELITSAHYGSLRRALRSYHTELILAGLSTVKRLNYAGALPEVERLIKCPAWFDHCVDIKREARNCYDALCRFEADARLNERC